MFVFARSRLKVLWIFLTLGVSLMILLSTTVYFQRGPTPVFLLEKGELRFVSFWRVSFYFHVIGSCVCLMMGPILMMPALLRFKRLHAVLGYVYLNVVLWIAAPSGLLISPFAKGGLISAAGFVATGIAWWFATWMGYRAIRNHEIQSHIIWMVRSYSIALSAVAFRIIQLILSYVSLSPDTSYTLAVWLSLAASFWISESCINRQFNRELAKPRKNFWITPQLKRKTL